jgi:hypothetical protein
MLFRQHVNKIKEVSETLGLYNENTDWEGNEDIDNDASALAEFKSTFHDIGTLTTNLL